MTRPNILSQCELALPMTNTHIPTKPLPQWIGRYKEGVRHRLFWWIIESGWSIVEFGLWKTHNQNLWKYLQKYLKNKLFICSSLCLFWEFILPKFINFQNSLPNISMMQKYYVPESGLRISPEDPPTNEKYEKNWSRCNFDFNDTMILFFPSSFLCRQHQ